MRNIHLLESAHTAARQSIADAASCAHGELLGAGGDAIRCRHCFSQLVMVPDKPGGFRLEWLNPSDLAIASLKCAA
jgi:hypothetical protein